MLIEEVSEPAISDVNISLKHDDFLVVVGMVGAGKTTLLHSIMEETNRRGGEQTVKGTVAYVEQEPFIFSATIKENILLGKFYDEDVF